MSFLTLDRLLGIRHPIMVAPMFLVSNTRMIVAALDCGVMAAFPGAARRHRGDTFGLWLEKLMHGNRTLRKYVKLLIALRGMKAVEKAAFGATYKTIWCAGPAIEHVREILPIREILKRLISEYEAAQSRYVLDKDSL